MNAKLIITSSILFIGLNCNSAFAGDVTKGGDISKGRAQFSARCASCHGNEGAGDGPLAASLPPTAKPRNLKSEPFKYATDAAKFKELMQKGGAGVGLNPLMTGAPGASDADIEDIYAFVMSLRKK